MKRRRAPLLRGFGLLFAVATSSFMPGPGGYDIATGATSTSSNANQKYGATVKAATGSKVKGTFTRTVTAKLEQFTGSIQLPLPNATAGIASAAAAADAEIALVLSRNGQDYADCTLDFSSLTNKKKTANYKLSLTIRRGELQQTAGDCQLLVLPLGPGLPQASSTDRLVLKSITPGGETMIATGTFAKK